MKTQRGIIIIEMLLLAIATLFGAAAVSKYDTTKKAEAQPTVQVAEQK